MNEQTKPALTATNGHNELEIPELVKAHPAWERLEDQLHWYDSKSVFCQQWYKRLRLTQIVCAVIIPIISHTGPWAPSLAGAFIAILEGVDHVYQFSRLWTAYRATAECLKHEKFLFLSTAGPYRELKEPERLILLAERVEERISTEHAKWVSETNRLNSEQKKENIPS